MTRLVEDRRLLEAFRSGESAALAQVYREYVRPVASMLSAGFAFESGGRRVFFKGLTEPWAREEALQEVFTRAFAPAARLAYDGIHPYRNYLFTIARNYVVDRLRIGDREIPCDFSLPESPEPSPLEHSGPPRPDEGLGQAQILRHCETFLSSLEPQERQLFDARFLQGLSIEETAKLVRISEHHVKRGEQRIKKRFFIHMKEHGYFEGLRFSRAGIEKILWMLLLVAAGAQP